MNDLRDSESPFGVLDFLSWDHEKFAYHYRQEDVEKSVALMREAGVGFVRFDFLWEDIEPERGRYDFTKYDRLVDTILQNGIKIHALLAYNPLWSSTSWSQAPDTVLYGHYASAVVNHFKDRIRHWQIWHEPDNPNFWTPQDHMTQYTTLVKHVYPLLKAIDPTCVVHLGGMSRSLPMCLKNVYEKGGGRSFDVINIHPFVNPLMPDALSAMRYLHQTVRDVQGQYEDEAKPIWFTEIGCPGLQNPKATKNWWLGANPDERVQAEWVQTVYGEPLRWAGVEKIFWCFFRDTAGHFQSGSDFDGLIRHDFSKKPSFMKYSEMASLEASHRLLQRR